MLSAADIIRFDDAPPPPGQSPWVDGQPVAEKITIVASNPDWPHQFGQLDALIRNALGPLALSIEHVGSTSVPDLPAKPIIDIDLVVEDSADEASWLPQLQAAGFMLRIREPWWYEHRCLRFDDPRCNLHVFSPDCPETIRHRIFRDWLRANANDRELYFRSKQACGGEDHHCRQHSRTGFSY